MKNVITAIFAFILILILIEQYELRRDLEQEFDKSRIRLIKLCSDNPTSFLPEDWKQIRTTDESCQLYINDLTFTTTAGSK